MRKVIPANIPDFIHDDANTNIADGVSNDTNANTNIPSNDASSNDTVTSIADAVSNDAATNIAGAVCNDANANIPDAASNDVKANIVDAVCNDANTIIDETLSNGNKSNIPDAVSADAVPVDDNANIAITPDAVPNGAAATFPDVIANDAIATVAEPISHDTVAYMPDASADTANVAAGSGRSRSGQPRRPKDAVVHTRTVEPGGRGVCFDLPTATIDNVKVDGLAVEVQSLEERVETIENAAHAGNLSLQQVGEATPANTITVMSIDHSSGTTGNMSDCNNMSAW